MFFPERSQKDLNPDLPVTQTKCDLSAAPPCQLNYTYETPWFDNGDKRQDLATGFLYVISEDRYVCYLDIDISKCTCCSGAIIVVPIVAESANMG